MTQALTTVLSAGGVLRESMTPFPFFRDATRSPAHLEIAVGVLSSTATGERQRSSGLVLTETEVRIALAYQLPSHAGAMRVSAVVGDEIRRHLLARTVGYPATFHMTWRREESSPLVAGWVIVEQIFVALHYMPT